MKGGIYNDQWKDRPMKCRNTWYTGGEDRDEDCPGFKKNKNYKEEQEGL
jgi:hypothetical protein